MAVTLVEPTVSVDVVNFAFPPLNWAVPNTVFPAVKVTGPVAVTVGEEIWAVKVTGCPRVEGFREEVSAAELVACVTIWFRATEVLPKLFASPE